MTTPSTTPTPSTKPTPATAAGRRKQPAARRPDGRRISRSEPRRAASPDLVAALAARLTGRDRWLLAMVAEHRVLTTMHLAALGFTGRRQAERRLAQLWSWRCVDRFRPFTPLGAGSAPYHWVLDDAGAVVLAAHHGIDVREFGYHRATALAVAHSEHLRHTIGTNTLLTALAARHHAVSDGSGRLVGWWGERRCAAAWGDLARPDAAAIWTTPNSAQPIPAAPVPAGSVRTAPTASATTTMSAAIQVGFAIEYDTGSEPLPRVAGKLADYADLAAAAGAVLPVLFWLPSVARETALHRQLDATGLLVATAAADHAAQAGGPTGPVWRPARPGLGARARPHARSSLDQLTAAWAIAGTLPVTAADLGLAWTAPDPHPPAAGPAAVDLAYGRSGAVAGR